MSLVHDNILEVYQSSAELHVIEWREHFDNYMVLTTPTNLLSNSANNYNATFNITLSNSFYYYYTYLVYYYLDALCIADIHAEQYENSICLTMEIDQNFIRQNYLHKRMNLQEMLEKLHIYTPSHAKYNIKSQISNKPNSVFLLRMVLPFGCNNPSVLHPLYFYLAYHITIFKFKTGNISEIKASRYEHQAYAKERSLYLSTPKSTYNMLNQYMYPGNTDNSIVQWNPIAKAETFSLPTFVLNKNVHFSITIYSAVPSFDSFIELTPEWAPDDYHKEFHSFSAVIKDLLSGSEPGCVIKDRLCTAYKSGKLLHLNEQVPDNASECLLKHIVNHSRYMSQLSSAVVGEMHSYAVIECSNVGCVSISFPCDFFYKIQCEKTSNHYSEEEIFLLYTGCYVALCVDHLLYKREVTSDSPCDKTNAINSLDGCIHSIRSNKNGKVFQHTLNELVNDYKHIIHTTGLNHEVSDCYPYEDTVNLLDLTELLDI